MKYFLLCLLSLLQVVAQGSDISMLRSLNINRNTSLDGSMQFISNSEYAVGILVPVSICAAAWATRKHTTLEKGVNISLAVILNTASTYVVKRVIDRPRPSVTYPDIQAFESERHYSFPSGHTSNAFCVATSLSLNYRKWYVALPAFAWAAGVGYSRMHLGMHYPSDVLAGALLGAGSAYATYRVNKWMKKKYEKWF
ncbi:MAG: phosphatase PAP2 family protein [Chitinophagaceae bacterium]|nr:phosphatase PAP2 family protein [Chitinophagaceae bacterium]